MKYYHLMLLLVIIMFSACVSQTVNAAGKVNGTAIPYNEYMAEFRNRWDAFSIQNNRPPSSDEKELLVAQTWQNITKDVILRQNFRKYGITASLQETIDTLKANPPAYIKSSPLFMVDGRFDPASYHQSLDYDRPENLSLLKRQYQSYYVPIAKLKNVLIDKQMLSPRDKTRINNIVSGSADIDWVRIDSRTLDASITDTEITEYYNANQSRWELEPRFSLGYVEMPVLPSETDDIQARALIDSLITAASDPKLLIDFANSHPTVRIKDSGYVFLMDLDASVKTRLSTLAEGALGEPFTEAGAWQVLQMVQMTKSMVKYLTYSVPVQAGKESAAAALPKAERLRDLVSQLGYARAAEEMDYSSHTHNDLSPNTKWIDDPGIIAAVNESLQSAKAGYTPAPMYFPAQSSWIVIQITDNQNKRFQPLSAVKDEIVSELRIARQKEIALRSATDWLASNPRDINDSKSLPGAMVVPQKAVNISSSLDGTAIGSIYFDALNRHHGKLQTQAYAVENYVLIPFVRTISPKGGPVVSASLLREYYALSLGPDWFADWMNEQVKNASVRIFTTQ